MAQTEVNSEECYKTRRTQETLIHNWLHQLWQDALGFFWGVIAHSIPPVDFQLLESQILLATTPFHPHLPFPQTLRTTRQKEVPSETCLHSQAIRQQSFSLANQAGPRGRA